MHKKSTNRLISIILPVYNASKTLISSVESILQQSYTNFELIIINDGSTDNSIRLLESLTDQRIRLYSRENKGLGYTLNEMLNLAEGELIARTDADDISLPKRLESQVSYFLKEPGLVMLGGQVDFLINGRVFPGTHMPLEHNEILTEFKKGRFPICHPAIMFKKSVALSFGGYRVSGSGEDLDFFLRMFDMGIVGNVSDTILQYRMESGSISDTKREALNLGYAFARYNANLRSRNLPEVDFDHFETRIWPNRGIFKKFKDFSYNFSEKYYRKSFYYRSEKKAFLAMINLLIVCFFRPRALLLRIKNTIFTGKPLL